MGGQQRAKLSLSEHFYKVDVTGSLLISSYVAFLLACTKIIGRWSGNVAKFLVPFEDPLILTAAVAGLVVNYNATKALSFFEGHKVTWTPLLVAALCNLRVYCVKSRESAILSRGKFMSGGFFVSGMLCAIGVLFIEERGNREAAALAAFCANSALVATVDETLGVLCSVLGVSVAAAFHYVTTAWPPGERSTFATGVILSVLTMVDAIAVVVFISCLVRRRASAVSTLVMALASFLAVLSGFAFKGVVCGAAIVLNGAWFIVLVVYIQSLAPWLLAEAERTRWKEKLLTAVEELQLT